MATAPKRKFDDRESEDILGYIHSVSEVTTAANSKRRYFSGNMQIQHNHLVRFVSFSPEKQSAMKSAETTKSPVKITNCILTPREDNMEIMIKKNSQISICKKLDFARSTKVERAAKLMSLQSIETANTMCSVKAKVASISTTTLVQTRYGQQQVQNVTIVDEHKSMVLALWQQHVDKVKADHYYMFENLISRFFQGDLQLSTTAKPLFKPTDKFEVTEDNSTRLNLTTSVGSVACCSLKTTSKCLNCNKPIDTDTNSSIVRCHHCLAKQKLTQAHITRTLSIQLDSLQMVKKLVIFNDVLNCFLAKYNLDNLNNDETENYILSVDEIILTHNIGSDIVVELDVHKEEDE